jgi:hypothetical protein
MGAGDTFLYSANRSDAHIKERKCIEKLATHPGNPIENLQEIWEEQEAGIAEAVKRHKQKQWLEDNATALASSNAYVEANGLPLARYRQC